MQTIKRKYKVYSPNFKIMVVEDMIQNELSYNETSRKYSLAKNNQNCKFLRTWERIYLEEGAEGFMKERRGRTTKLDNPLKGRPPNLEKALEEDLITEVQRLRAENDYLKKLHALALSKAQKTKK